MGLQQLQEVMVRLYTEPSFRVDFFADPVRWARSLSLTEAELASLQALGFAEVDDFSQSLVNKRRGEVRKLLPITVKLLGTHWREVFDAHAAVYVPGHPRIHHDDAQGFVRALPALLVEVPVPHEEAASGTSAHSLWIEAVEDVARFEALRWALPFSSRRLVVCRFCVDVLGLLGQLRQASEGAFEGEVVRGRFVGVWWRWSSSGPFRFRWLRWGMRAQVHRLCEKSAPV